MALGEGARLTLRSGRTMKVSVLITGSAVALVSTCILAGSVASAAISTERQQQYLLRTAGENRGQSEASTVKACLAADPPRAWAAASQGGEINKLREAAR
jgi:hypothetical protein